MKALKVCFVMLLFFYLLPLGAFCHDSHASNDATEHGHCVLMCSSSCNHAVVYNTGVSIAASLPNLNTSLPFISLSYQNPFLDHFKLPPIVTS